MILEIVQFSVVFLFNSFVAMLLLSKAFPALDPFLVSKSELCWFSFAFMLLFSPFSFVSQTFSPGLRIVSPANLLPPLPLPLPLLLRLLLLLPVLVLLLPLLLIPLRLLLLPPSQHWLLLQLARLLLRLIQLFLSPLCLAPLLVLSLLWRRV